MKGGSIELISVCIESTLHLYRFYLNLSRTTLYRNERTPSKHELPEASNPEAYKVFFPEVAPAFTMLNILTRISGQSGNKCCTQFISVNTEKAMQITAKIPYNKLHPEQQRGTCSKRSTF